MHVEGRAVKRPVGSRLSNQDVFVWALHLLGGSDHPVDVEDIYLKCFELAPARLGWRTRPDLPDYKKTSKALQAVEAKTHVGLIVRVDQYNRRLSAAGRDWIQANSDVLIQRYSSANSVAATTRSPHERLRRRIRASHIFTESNLDLASIAEILECSPASDRSVWNARVEQLQIAADALQDDSLRDFCIRITAVLKSKGIS